MEIIGALTKWSLIVFVFRSDFQNSPMTTSWDRKWCHGLTSQCLSLKDTWSLTKALLRYNGNSKAYISWEGGYRFPRWKKISYAMLGLILTIEYSSSTQTVSFCRHISSVSYFSQLSLPRSPPISTSVSLSIYEPHNIWYWIYLERSCT